MDDKKPAVHELSAVELECVSGGDGFLSWVTGLISSTNGSTDNGGATLANNASTGLRG